MVLLLAGCLTACAGSGSGGGGGTPPRTSTTISSGTISFRNNIQPVFNRSCALSGCHKPPASIQQLNLAKNASYSQLVNVPSTQNIGAIRVIPGNADASYLIQKIEGTPGIGGVLMPQGCPGGGTGLQGAPCLTGDQIAMFRTWVTEGAPNN